MLIVVAFAGPAIAGSIGLDQWYEFEFGLTGSMATDGSSTVASSGGNSVFADSPAWTITLLSGADLTVTDAFLKGDEFEVFNFGSSIGSTPVVASSGSGTNDPELAILDPGYSSASFFLAPGSYSFTIKVTDSPFGGGAGYFRVASVPEPSTLLLLGGGLLGLAGFRRKFKV